MEKWDISRVLNLFSQRGDEMLEQYLLLSFWFSGRVFQMTGCDPGTMWEFLAVCCCYFISGQSTYSEQKWRCTLFSSGLCWRTPSNQTIFVFSRKKKMEPWSYGGPYFQHLGALRLWLSRHPLVPKASNACFLAVTGGNFVFLVYKGESEEMFFNIKYSTFKCWALK